MLEESYKDLISKGYSKEFLNKISDVILNECKMHQNIRYINLYKNRTIVKCIAITDEGTYYRIVEQIRDKNKSYEATENFISKDMIDILAEL